MLIQWNVFGTLADGALSLRADLGKLPPKTISRSRSCTASHTAVPWASVKAPRPYGDGGLPEELDCVGREFFAADPEEGVAVSFSDLPEVTREALDAKRQKANGEGWERLLGGLPFEDDK